MKSDPVIDEIRAVRHRISERFGHDTHALVEHYRQMEKDYADRMLTEPRRRACDTVSSSGSSAVDEPRVS